ncbi:MAG: nuclear transport factor 2 family protein [Bacteroidetes bacterium]|nr:nuclear transport factor 2 family protein [Bacteroidota bacterium]
MEHTKLIVDFYTAFSEGNAHEMKACYHDEITFHDPAFGELKGERACKMWEMLLSRKKQIERIELIDFECNDETGSANWKAVYRFGPKKRKVVNHVHAVFKFNDGKIVEHHDSFNLWKWSRQALGPIGWFLGWTPFMQRKIQTSTNKQLDKYLKKF